MSSDNREAFLHLAYGRRNGEKMTSTYDTERPTTIGNGVPSVTRIFTK